ncbi:MAG: phosphate-starvation-inducible PsiE family protein [Dehalococcoidia bacterium]
MAREPNRMRRLLRLQIDPFLEWVDVALYTAAALLFLAVALIYGVYAVVTFAQHFDDSGPGAFTSLVLDAITNLLLVLIVLEVVGTIRSYLTTGATSLKPFLYIGIISAVRRILEIGAASALGGTDEALFRHRVIELGVDAAVVLALAVALYLFARQERDSLTTEETPPVP